MERWLAVLLEKYWHDLHNSDCKRRAWRHLIAEFNAALPAGLADRVTKETVRAKLGNERYAISEDRWSGVGGSTIFYLFV